MSRLGACDELDGIGEEWSDEGRGHRQNALLCGDALVPGRGDTPVGDARALPPVARLRDLLPRGGRPPRDPGGGAALPAAAVDIRGGDPRQPGCRGAVGLHARRGGAPRADGRGSGGGRRAGCRMHERGRGAGRAADDAVLAVPQTRPGPSSTAENQAPKGLKHAEPSSFEGNTMGEYPGHGESVNLSPGPPRRCDYTRAGRVRDGVATLGLAAQAARLRHLPWHADNERRPRGNAIPRPPLTAWR